jgi:LPPG:FO 2-phospho-L-lactate transferase
MKVVALAGGVGGARLAAGLAQLLSPDQLTIIVNTGDDFRHLGLSISPDVDTVCYTLAGLANPATGWGRLDDTYTTLENITRLNGPDWFHLGDKDLATHIERTRRLNSGETLTQVTLSFCKSWGVDVAVLPMSDDPVSTLVDTVEYGELPFQDYFVMKQCQPKVRGFRFAGMETARPTQQVLHALEQADAFVICPSNPWVSIDPLLKLPGFRQVLERSREDPDTKTWGGRRPVVAVSPIIHGKTVKGPAAKMFAEMGIQPSALAVAGHYADLLSGFVLDLQDAGLKEELHIPVLVTDTLMRSASDQARLAQDVLNFIKPL